MKIFIINLKRRDDKLSRMNNRLCDLDLGDTYDVEIFNAIDGNIIDNDYLETQNYRIDKNWTDNIHKRPIKMGEIGCSLSHYMLWKKIVEDDLKFAIILEDDVLFKEKFKEKINFFTKDIKYDMLYLGRKVFNKKERSINEYMVDPNFSYWTLGYILTNRGAEKLINAEFEKNIIPVDEFLPYMYGKNMIDNYNLIDICNNNKRLITYALKEDIIKPESCAFRESDTEISEILKMDNNENILVISVATYETDCYKRFIKSLEHFNIEYKILGLSNVKFSMEGPGGGFKVKLLKDYFKTTKISDDTLIIFTDSFDVIFNDNGKNIISKYYKLANIDKTVKNIDLANRGKIVFSAELACWPDTELTIKYPEVDTKYKYLNSGGFMGYFKDIKKLIETRIDNLDDDQLYYTKKFLEPESNIILDYKCEIFQTLYNVSSDIQINIDRSEVINKYTKSSPSIIHGNSNSKPFFNSLANYIPNRWSEIYGYMEVIQNIEKKFRPNIAIVCNNINNMLKLNYDRDKIYYFTNGNYNQLYTSKKIYYLKSMNTETENRIKVLEIIKSLSKTDNIKYVMFIDDEHILNKIDINDLIKHDKEIIAPMLVRPDTLFSNFWGAIGNDGYYERSDDYIDIVNKKRRGVWCVPYIQNTFIFKIEIIDQIIGGYKNRPQMDMDMRLCKHLRYNNYLIYIDNLVDYGHITSDN